MGTPVSYFSSAERLHCNLCCLLPPSLPLAAFTCWAGERIGWWKLPKGGREGSPKLPWCDLTTGCKQAQGRDLGNQDSECECLTLVVSNAAQKPPWSLYCPAVETNDIRESYLCCILWASWLKIQSYQKPSVRLLLSMSCCVAHCGCYWYLSFANLSVEWEVLKIFGWMKTWRRKKWPSCYYYWIIHTWLCSS